MLQQRRFGTRYLDMTQDKNLPQKRGKRQGRCVEEEAYEIDTDETGGGDYEEYEQRNKKETWKKEKKVVKEKHN